MGYSNVFWGGNILRFAAFVFPGAKLSANQT
jgi:acyl dehydratase